MIHLMNFFSILQKNTPADIAKKRLKTIVSEYKFKKIKTPNYLPELKQDLIKVVCKYVQTNYKVLSFQFSEKNDNISILELHIILKETEKRINT